MTKRDKRWQTNEIEMEIIERHVIKICFRQKFESEFRIFVGSKILKRSDFYLISRQGGHVTQLTGTVADQIHWHMLT